MTQVTRKPEYAWSNFENAIILGIMFLSSGIFFPHYWIHQREPKLLAKKTYGKNKIALLSIELKGHEFPALKALNFEIS